MRILFLLALLAAGCGNAKMAAKLDEADGAAQRSIVGGRQAANPAAAPPVGGGKPPAAKEPDRKIIYEGTVSLVVPEVDAATEQVRATAKQFDAYLASSDVSGTAGSRRNATFTLRVPADKFEPLREALAKLGEVTRNSSKSEDVTDEFYDLDARLKVLKKEEDALGELLKKEAGKLDELLKVREQLTKVREQIEKAEGRQQFLSKKVAFSTVVVTLSETKDYVPPTNPTFGGRVDSTFWRSVNALEEAGKGAVYVLVALVPWLPLILLALWLLRRGIRWAKPRFRALLGR